MHDLEYGVKAAGRAPLHWNSSRLFGRYHWPFHVLFFVAVCALIYSRLPAAISHAQFWAEDGATWYSDAYNFGPFRSMVLQYAGYFELLPRVGAALALLVPLRFAPFVMNLIGLIFQALPASFLVSSRCAAWASLPVRLCFALSYIALPNSKEINVSITNVQWHVALLACLVVLAAVPRNKVWQVFDVCVLLLSGLSGPFAIILLPVALAFWWFRREQWRLIIASVVGFTALVQVAALLKFGAARSHFPLGATPALFLKLLSGQVYLGALIGENGYSLRPDALPLEVFAILGSAVIIYTIVKANLEMRLVLLFCMALFLAEMRSPLVSLTQPQWQVLQLIPGARYWFFPMLGFVWSLIWCAAYDRSRFVPGIGLAGLITMSFGIYSDWSYPRFENEHFSKYTKEMAQAPPGRMFVIPLYPGGWEMRIATRAPHCGAMPIGSIDSPGPGAKISGPTRIEGWAGGEKPVKSVSVYIDDVLVGTVPPTIERKDADGFSLLSHQRFKGWVTQVNVSKLQPGKHEIRARALEENGCSAEFALTPVEKVP